MRLVPSATHRPTCGAWWRGARCGLLERVENNVCGAFGKKGAERVLRGGVRGLERGLERVKSKRVRDVWKKGFGAPGKGMKGRGAGPGKGLEGRGAGLLKRRGAWKGALKIGCETFGRKGAERV